MLITAARQNVQGSACQAQVARAAERLFRAVSPPAPRRCPQEQQPRTAAALGSFCASGPRALRWAPRAAGSNPRCSPGADRTSAWLGADLGTSRTHPPPPLTPPQPSEQRCGGFKLQGVVRTRPPGTRSVSGAGCPPPRRTVPPEPAAAAKHAPPALLPPQEPHRRLRRAPPAPPRAAVAQGGGAPAAPRRSAVGARRAEELRAAAGGRAAGRAVRGGRRRRAPSPGRRRRAALPVVVAVVARRRGSPAERLLGSRTQRRSASRREE